jgi:hypothetical protein
MDKGLPEGKDQTTTPNVGNPPLFLLLRTTKDDIVPVDTERDFPPDRILETKVIQEAKEGEREVTSHELAPTLDTQQASVRRDKTLHRVLHGELPDTVGYFGGRHSYCFQHLVVDVERNRIRRRSIVPGDEDLTIQGGKLLEP